LLVFVAVLVGAQVAGGWGAIFGVPLAAMIVLLARLFYTRVILSTPLYHVGAVVEAGSAGESEELVLKNEGHPGGSPQSAAPRRAVTEA
ncbi:MAG TPA: hypothetical protein VGW38_20360, partial [Chloroflexota bacterium]|nr:hypothetical protein [Chloroflexota bacterium]